MANLSAAYREFSDDVFPPRMELAFYDEAGRRTALFFEKVQWTIEGEKRGLRYGENPDQSAALYRPCGGNLSLAGGTEILPDGKLVCAAELLQSGKHPGKINLTDVDSALAILRYMGDSPACAIMKHNNPSGLAVCGSLVEAYRKAWRADCVAAFGGAVVVNRALDAETAREISSTYIEIVAAPDFEAGTMEILAEKKNLRVIRLPEMARLEHWTCAAALDFKSLLDGGIIIQTAFSNRIRTHADFLPAECTHKDTLYRVEREASAAELDDMIFGWAVECGITSNSVIFVKDGATIGIGTGEQDRVGVAEIARDKAYRKLEDRLCRERAGIAWNQCDDDVAKRAIAEDVRAIHGGLEGSIMVSDAFFPLRDGIDVGLKEGVTAVVQPGGSIRDFESIQACNEIGAAMKFTGQRCFKH